MSIRFSPHALQRIKERFPNPEDTIALLRSVTEKLPTVAQRTGSGRLRVSVRVHFRRAMAVLTPVGPEEYRLITVVWCD